MKPKRQLLLTPNNIGVLFTMFELPFYVKSSLISPSLSLATKALVKPSLCENAFQVWNRFLRMICALLCL